MKRFLLWVCGFTLLLSSQSLAQVDTAWVRRAAFPVSNVRAMRVGGSGSVYITGCKAYYSDVYIWTARYSRNGALLWEREWSPPGVSFGLAMASDDSEYVYVAGLSVSSSGGYVAIKYDSSGNEAWSRTYTGGTGTDRAAAVAVDPSGNVYVSGQSPGTGTGLDFPTVKYDRDGNQLWASRYDGPAHGDDGMDPFWGSLHKMALDRSGNVYITGFSKEVGPGYAYVTVKYAPDGSESWARRYRYPGGDTTNQDAAYALDIDPDGNVYVAGRSNGAGTDLDYAVVKYDSMGNELWARRYNDPWNRRESAADLMVDRQGYVSVTGWSEDSLGRDDYLTIRYSPSGGEMWVRRYTGTGLGDDVGQRCALDDSGNIYVTGNSWTDNTYQYDYCTVKYSPSGDTLWSTRYLFSGGMGDYPRDLFVDGAGNVYVTGESYVSGSYDPLTIKYKQTTTGVEANSVKPSDSNRLHIQVSSPIRHSLLLKYVLPRSEVVRLELFDALGRRVRTLFEGMAGPGWHELRKPLNLPGGVYFVRLEAGEENAVQKVEVVR
jgi:hypothetical protein